MESLVVDTLSREKRYFTQIDYFNRIEHVVNESFSTEFEIQQLVSELKELVLNLYIHDININTTESLLVQSIKSKMAQLFLFMCIHYEYFGDLKEAPPLHFH